MRSKVEVRPWALELMVFKKLGRAGTLNGLHQGRPTSLTKESAPGEKGAIAMPSLHRRISIFKC